MPDRPVSASGPVWICASCGEAVEYVEPLRRPRIFVEVTGRATLEMDGSVLHQCAPGSYPAPTFRGARYPARPGAIQRAQPDGED
jgi:hypothetical protein